MSWEGKLCPCCYQVQPQSLFLWYGYGEQSPRGECRACALHNTPCVTVEQLAVRRRAMYVRALELRKNLDYLTLRLLSMLDDDNDWDPIRMWNRQVRTYTSMIRLLESEKHLQYGEC